MKTITRSIRIRTDLNKLLKKHDVNVSRECETALEEKAKSLEKSDKICPYCDMPLEGK